MHSFFKAIGLSMILLPVICFGVQQEIVSPNKTLYADLTFNNLTHYEMHVSIVLKKWKKNEGITKKTASTLTFPKTPAILPGPTSFKINDIASEDLTIKEIKYFSQEDSDWKTLPNMPYNITLNTKEITGSALTHISVTIQQNNDKPNTPILISSNVN